MKNRQKIVTALIYALVAASLVACGGGGDSSSNFSNPPDPSIESINITSQPVGMSVRAGGDVTFSVVATGGSSLKYQWLMNGNDIIGANASSWTYVNASIDANGSKISVRITDAADKIKITTPVVLTVLADNSVRPVLNLNDTGVQFGAKDAHSNNETCIGETIDAQDCSNGADRTDGSKIGISFGSAGFNFTKIDNNGNQLPSQASSWSCVFDNNTGLLWDVSVGNDLTNWGDDRDGDAKKYTKEVNKSLRCGVGNWRLPTPVELHSIVHYGVGNPEIFTTFPMIDDRAFPNTPFRSFWTSSYNNTSPFLAWAVSFEIGSIRSDETKNSGFSVRLVSSAPLRTTGRWIYELNSSEVIDTVHNLIWQRCAVGQNWTGGTCSGTPIEIDWLSALKLASQNGVWRLPNIKELATLVDTNVLNYPRVDPDAFPGESGISFWSSTPSVDLEFDSYVGSSGEVVYGGGRTTFLHGVRLVRNR